MYKSPLEEFLDLTELQTNPDYVSNLLKTAYSKNITIQEWNTLIYQFQALISRDEATYLGFKNVLEELRLHRDFINAVGIPYVENDFRIDPAKLKADTLYGSIEYLHDEKLDKVSETGEIGVYAHDVEGNQVTLPATAEPRSDSLVYRDENGNAQVATPITDYQIANKKYVDERVANIDLSAYPTYDHVYDAIDANIEHIKGYADTTFANALKGSASGEAVLLDDVSPVEHDVGVKVRSKNLLQLHDAGYSVTKGGVTFTWLDDGRVQVNGTATEDVEVHVNKVKYTLKGGVKYFISGCPSGGSKSTYYLHYRGYDQDFGSGRVVGGQSDFTNDVDIMVKSGVTVNNLIFSPMLELGATGTAFAPHIEDLSAVKVSQYGKNLCDRTKFKPFGSGTITLIDNGLIYTGSYYMTLDVSFVQIGVPYRVSWKYKTSDSITPIYRILYEDGSYSSTLANGNGFTPTKAVKSILIYPEMTGTIYTTTFTDIQIEIGNAPTEYEPYTAPVEYPVNSDGSVDGVRSAYPSMTMLADTAGAVVECNYNRDLNKAFEKITQAIISIGGNV